MHNLNKLQFKAMQNGFARASNLNNQIVKRCVFPLQHTTCRLGTTAFPAGTARRHRTGNAVDRGLEY